MKKYEIKNENSVYFAGETNEIKAMFKSIRHAYDKGNTELFPYFRNPQFSSEKNCYAIEIDEEMNVFVRSSDTMMALILNYGAREVEA